MKTITKVVGNKGSVFYGRYVVIMFTQQDGQLLCRFTGKYITENPVSFEESDLITIAEYKKICLEESE